MTTSPSQHPLTLAITKQHAQLEELMLLHQEALIIQNIELAQDVFKHYVALQLSHLAFENEHLLPLLNEAEQVQWPASLYLHEHNKISKMLGKNQARLNQPNHTNYRRWLIETIEQQKSLKNVLEHHEAREEQGLLTELATLLSAEHTDKLIALLNDTTEPALCNVYDRSKHWLEEIKETV